LRTEVFWHVMPCHWMRDIWSLKGLQCLQGSNGPHFWTAWPLKITGLQSFKTWSITQPVTQHHMPEDPNPRQHHR